MVANGELGDIRIVQLQFAHGFHSAPVEELNPAIKWRVDPRAVSYVRATQNSISAFRR